MSNDPSQSPLTQADLDRLLSHNLFKQTQSVKGILWMSFSARCDLWVWLCAGGDCGGLFSRADFGPN